jgi:sugar diacid utilization regulator
MRPAEDAEILQLTAMAVEAIGCQATGVLLDLIWQEVGGGGSGLSPAEVASSGYSPSGGPIDSDGLAWTWVYPMSAESPTAGYLVVDAAQEPAGSDRQLLQSIARHAGAALVSARSRFRERAREAELRSANLVLRRSIEMHDRLTQAVMGGGGQHSIATAIHELTGHGAGTQDAFGNLIAWAGGSRPGPAFSSEPERRVRTMNRALAAPGPVRDGEWLVSVAQLAGALVGAVVLADPDQTAGDAELAAIAYAGSLLAMEITRLQNLGESPARARINLALELVSGGDEPSILSRARSLGYNLLRPHRVVALERAPGSDAGTGVFFDAVSRAAHALCVGELLAPCTDDVLVLANTKPSWECFHERIVSESEGTDCSMGVGGPCEQVADFQRSHREAKLALRIQAAVGKKESVTVFDDLGVYQVLATEADTSAMESFVTDWLGDLMRYDADHGTELVETLSEFLDCGGSYNSTAAALSVHRSTLKYRLRRIREVSRHDISVPDAQFNLQVATRAWRTLRALRGS